MSGDTWHGGGDWAKTRPTRSEPRTTRSVTRHSQVAQRGGTEAEVAKKMVSEILDAVGDP